MLSQGRNAHTPHSVSQLRAPCDDAMKTLSTVLQAGCSRLKLPETLATTVVSQDWTWAPIAPSTVGKVFEIFHSLTAVIAEAQRVIAYNRSQGGDARAYLLADRQLTFVHQQLTQDFSEHLSQAEEPLEVLKILLRHPKMRATSSCVSALLGLHDEKDGGDEGRHSALEQRSFYARGGYMYQASDLFEVGGVFSKLSLKPGITFYDLGSGYGHVLFCGAASRRDVNFLGIELMPVRVAECNRVKDRLGLTNISCSEGDVTKGGFADADVIFLFNPFPPDTQAEVTELIDELARVKPLAIIDYGGFVTQRLTSVTPIVASELAPYRLVGSKTFLNDSCALVGLPLPSATSTTSQKGNGRARKGKRG